MPSPARKPLATETLAKMLPIFTGLIAVGYAVSAYAFLFMPKLGRTVAGGDLDLKPYQDRIAEAAAYQTQLKGYQTAFASVNAERRARVQDVVPDSLDGESLYVLLDTITQAHGGVLASIETSPDTKRITDSGRRAVRATASIRNADYQSIKLILTDLERASRVIDVQSVVFTAGTKTYGIVFRAYSFDPERLRTAPYAEPPSGTAGSVTDPQQ